MKSPRKVEVTWLDHHDWSKDQVPITAPEELEPMIWKSTGYLVSENDTMLELVRDWPMSKGVTDIGAPLRILKSSIVKRSDKKGG